MESICLIERKPASIKKRKMKDLTCADTGGREKIRFVRKKMRFIFERNKWFYA